MLTSFSMRVAAESSVMFLPLTERRETLVFPTDREGHVDLDTVSEQMRKTCLVAGGMIGHQFGSPIVLVKNRQ